MSAQAFTYHVMTKGHGIATEAMVACTTFVSTEALEALGWKTRHVCHNFDEALTAKGALEDEALGITPTGMVTP